MADSSRQDVELIPRSAGVLSPSDAPATTTTTDHTAIQGDAREGIDEIKNGLVIDKDSSRMDEQLLEDGSARSDTDTSRAGSIAGDNKSTDIKPVKKFAASKPVSFAKYSVPKTIAANAPVKAAVEKAPVAAPTLVSSHLLGRPRLVAKSASSLQHKTVPFKPSAPDPMQVWNKNRVTPQPSTKHLTDEELKKQYDIHLTPRIQSDGDGKEAKWADIDDDEDDWAPETIEWNDGTKTTVNAADAPAAKPNNAASNESVPDSSRSDSVSSKPATPQYSSTIGPNATVLKIGANLERQQAQKAAAQQLKSPAERAALLSSKTAPAPPPSKSPWQKVPAVDKVSPIAINPQPIPAPQASKYPPLGGLPVEQPPTASSPAKEISADDFNRSWRHSPSSQTRELFNSSSGRYETVTEGRRRMSKNEQNFRAPAVLQRPGQTDTRAPAEPSPAFQTHRTSVDQGRRRASSSISGGSGPFARRMSFKSNDAPGPVVDSRDPQVDVMSARPASHDDVSPSLPTPNTYQARGGDYITSGPGPMTDGDIEVQRAAQKAAMKENIERARKRKQEEEQRIQAEKEERIRAKLASLGPPPDKPKPEEDKIATTSTQLAPATLVQSPPRPPQPLATGEPQQYGMMRVHPLDSVRKINPGMLQHTDQSKLPSTFHDTSAPAVQPHTESSTQPPMVNGNHVPQESAIPFTDDDANPEPSPKFGRAVVSNLPDARTSWGAARNEHRSAQAGNLWGLPSNKALGNGTFDQSLAGYSPQDLSRTSSAGQPWMNGRTPNVGQSPQLHHANQTVPETRSHILQSMTSPGQQPLSLNSEVDSAQPISRPAPIGPPQANVLPPNNGPPVVHAFPNQPQANTITAWNNFHNVARVNERAETERFQRDLSERREEEKRTGVRQQAPYGLNETFKQVQVGEQVGQRHISNVAQTTHAPGHMFGAIGSLASNEVLKPTNGQAGRGSRFFPPTATGQPAPPQDRRAVTFSHFDVPRSPSPPPAEEYASYHPAFDGNLARPVVHFPPVRPVVRLPPPPPPVPAAPPIASKESSPIQPKVPMTWAARVSMPAPVVAPPPVSRVVSMPLVQNPSWQERFNGLLGKKEAAGRASGQSERAAAPAPADAVTREPLDVAVAVSAFVSLPAPGLEVADIGRSSTKDVEGEEDLFEDREAGSLPIVHFPRDILPTSRVRISIPRSTHSAIDPITAHMFMVNNWSERHGQQKPQYAIIRAPGTNGKGIRKDLASKATEATDQAKARHSPGHFGSQKFPRGKMGVKARPMAKAH